jgi:hypothetical protein
MKKLLFAAVLVMFIATAWRTERPDALRHGERSWLCDNYG